MVPPPRVRRPAVAGRIGRLLEQCRAETAAAARSLGRAPWFSLLAVLTLAVGMAATSLTFTLVQGTLLRPLPVRDEGRLFVARKQLPSGTRTLWPYSRTEIDAVRASSRLLEDAGGVGWNDLGGEGAAIVTGRFFGVLGVEPVLGRALTPEDDVPGAERVLVLSHATWQGRFGGSPDVLDQKVDNGEPFRIVGVMPPDLAFPRGASAWLTVTAQQSLVRNPIFREAVASELQLVGRLRSGVSLEQAHDELALLMEESAPTEGRSATVPKPALRPLTEMIVGEVRRPLLMLLGAVALVLLIASANVANLLLLRSESRLPSLAVRSALGASPGRIALLLGAEVALLALAATAIGLAVTPLALPVLLAVLPEGLPRVEAVRFDAGVIAFGFALACLAAGLSLLPALALTRVDLVSHFGGRAVSASPRAQRGRRVLVVAQVALAVAVVAAADLLTRSLLRLESAETGMASERLVFLTLGLPERYDDGERLGPLLDAVVERLEGVPGLEGATPVITRPFSGTGGWDVLAFAAEGQDPERAAENPALNLEAVHPGYFAALGIPIERGRAFERTDDRGAPDAVVLSRDVAEALWPGEDPIGRRIEFGGPGRSEVWRRIVGVVGPTRYRDYADPRPTVYVPAQQFLVAARNLAVRSALPAGAVAERARAVARQVDPAILVAGAAPFEELRRAPLARPRFNALLSALFAIAALVLATGGLHAVVSAWVRQRYPELALRVALGATRSDLRRLVLREGLGVAAAGAALGFGAAIATSRVFESLVFEAPALDLWSPAGAAAALEAAAVLACLAPTRLASRLDVVSVLRRP